MLVPERDELAGNALFNAAAGAMVGRKPCPDYLASIPEAIIETMTGRIHFMIAPFGSSAGLVRDGKLRAIVNKLNREIARALKHAEVEARLLAVGIEPAISSPEGLDKIVVDQLKEARDLARQAGIKPE